MDDTPVSTSPRPPEPFRCEVERDRDRVRVAAAGELDIASAPELARCLNELREMGVRRVVLDLRQLSFMDSSGIRTILREHALAESARTRFELIAGPPQVQRVLDVAGVLHRLNWTMDLATESG